MIKGTKHDGGKTRWDIMPWHELQEVAEVFTCGAKKYGDDNYKHGMPNMKARLSAAALRHVTAWLSGKGCDVETGKSHLAHAVCCVLMLMWGQRHRWGQNLKQKGGPRHGDKHRTSRQKR